MERLRQEDIDAGHVDMVFAKPIDTDLVDTVLARCSKIITVEDGCLIGGMGAAIAEYVMDRGLAVRLRRLGIPDEFIAHGSPADQRAYCGLDQEAMYQAALELLGS